jgi:hypothetical protein
MRRLIPAACAAALLLTACGDGEKPKRTSTAAPTPAAVKGAGPAYAADPTGGPGAPTAPAHGRVVARSGFDLAKDSFSFENYGRSRGTGLRAQEVQELFGDGVCVDPSAGTCRLTPAAERWRLLQNANWNTGHCYGFSTLALALKDGTASPSTYGGATTHALQIANRTGDVINPELEADLSRDASVQALGSVLRKTRRYTPKELVAKLRTAFAAGDEDYVLGFQMPGYGGHAVVPIAVEDMGAGKYDIVLYDNNWPYVPARPASADRRMHIDTRRDRWQYTISVNPDVKEDNWFGVGRENPLMLTSAKDQQIPQPCPFCDDAPADTPTLVALTGDAARHGHLRITDAKGRVTGWDGARTVNEIPGAQVHQAQIIERGLVEPEPLYDLPPGRAYRVELVDVPAGAPAGTIHASGPGVGVGLSRLTATGSTLTLGADGAVGVEDADAGGGAALPELRVATGDDRELRLRPDADRVVLKPAAGDDVRISGKVTGATVRDAATGKAAAVPSGGGSLDLDSLVGTTG